LINQQHTEQQSHTEAEHHGTLIDRMAHSIGFYTARTYLGIQNIRHTAHEETHQQDQLKRDQAEPSEQTAPGQPSEQHAPSKTRKAEEMLDHLAHRLGSLTTTAKLNFQRAAARVREDTEDMLAEAQDIRHHGDHPITQ
jgi:hypothetical protein